MPDIFRFQVSRAPQRRVPNDATLVKPLDFSDLSTVATRFLTSQAEKEKFAASIPHASAGNITRLLQEAMMLLTAPLAQRLTLARTVVLGPESVGQPQSTPLLSVIPQLDRWFVTHDDMPGSAALQNELERLGTGIRSRSSADPGTSALEAIVLDPEFWGDRIRLARMLAATIVDNEPIRTSFDVRARIVRLVLIAALIEDMALAATLPAPAELFRMLRLRTISLPERLLAPLRRPNPSIRRPGFSDLFVVRENWLRYEAGEIAHIENVLAHELKEHIHQRIDEEEVTTLSESSESKTTERDTQTTDRFELQTAASEELSAALAVNASVDTKSMLPSTTIDAHVGGSVEVAYSQSNSRASTQAREVVSRAAERVQTAVHTARTKRTLSRVTETNTHTFDNKDNDEHVAGIYRWVDKVKRLELVRYPNRFLVDLHIPEPGSWLRWALEHPEQNPDLPPNPGEFPAIDPEDITFDDAASATDYRRLAAKYAAREIKPQPSHQILSTVLLRDPTAGEKEETENKIEIRNHYYKETGPTVPAGMVATTWEARVSAVEKAKAPSDTSGGGLHTDLGTTINGKGGIFVNVGTDMDGTVFQEEIRGATLAGTVGDINTGTIPISVVTSYDFGFVMHVTVTMVPTVTAITAWKMETYEALRDAHAQAAQRYREAKATAETMRGVAFDAMSPAMSRQLMTSEMRRAAVELLLGEEGFKGHLGLMLVTPSTGEPGIDHEQAARSAPRIQFMEQAFEWGNMTWMLYPYFWANRVPWGGVGGWRPLAFQQSADPDLDAFLGAGAARLVVPARPGFEAQVQLFLEYGILWGGGPVPGPEDAGYVSVADEIRSMQQGANDGEITDTWDISLPTTLVILDTESQLPVTNPAYQTP